MLTRDKGYSSFALKLMLIGTILIIVSVIVYTFSKYLKITNNTMQINDNFYEIILEE